ncbi:MAG: amidohydrolase family protein [Gemmataceae bacterium]|nr:amidohydrolase family protein [Gemmataceae bacterium]
MIRSNHAGARPVRTLAGLPVLLWLAVSGVAAQTPSLQDIAGKIGPADTTTIYVAREFLTMDPAKPKAQAVAVRDGRFVALGTLADVQAAVGRGARVDTTFADKVVSAGFVEQHVHPVLAALTMNTRVISIEDWDAIDGFSPAVRDEKGYQDRLAKDLAGHTDKSKSFITWGYHHYMHGPMSRTLLDRLAPDFPVIVWHRSCHEFFLNSAALKKTGIDAAFVAGMSKSAQEQSSFEKGHFFEQGALAILGKLTPELATPARFKAGLEYTVKYYHRNGITVACEPGGFFSKPLQDMINDVYSNDSTPFNHYFMADGKTFAARNPTDAGALVKDSESVLSWGRGRTVYLPKQVKLLTDGAIFSQLMMMKDGYTDGHKGAWIMDPPVFGFAFQAYWDAEYQIHTHNNGDAGLEVLVGELEKAMKRNPRKDHRSVLIHFGFANADLVKRWIELGGVISSNPYYVTALAGPYAKIGLGPDRAAAIVPHSFVLKNQGSLSFHSDMPMAPAKPLELIWAGVTRTTYEGQVAGPEHRVPLDVALRAMTIDAAYSIQLEKEIGSIAVGKKANLTVLDKSPHEVDPKDLKSINVWGTMLEGRLQPVKPAAPQVGRLPAPSGAAVPPETPGRSSSSLAWNTRHDPRSNCGPGCSCRIGHLLAAHMLATMEK